MGAYRLAWFTPALDGNSADYTIGKAKCLQLLAKTRGQLQNVVQARLLVQAAEFWLCCYSLPAFRHFFIQTWNCLNPESILDSVGMSTPSHVA